MKKLILFILLFSGLSYASESPTEKTKWQKLLGQWQIIDSQVVENRAWASPWEYYELLKYNTIITIKPLLNHNSIIINSSIFDRFKSPSEFMISFAVTSESASWFYHMYAFKLTGGFWGMNKVSFIHSDRLDKTKPFATKNNTFVKELASADCKVKYDKMYNYRIAFEGTDVVLYINGEKILAAPFPEKSHEGRIAISARNVKIAVDKVEVKQGDKIIFEDDFNEDSIYVRTLKVRRETAPKENETEKPD